MELLVAPVRQRAGLSRTDHRPWPLRGEPWTIAQSWEELVFMHWRVDAKALRELVPEELELQEHDGSAWLGLTPFLLTGFRLRGTLPVPLVSTFPELNVRTYVTAEDKPGIWFFSLDTPSRLAVEAARRAYRLPYFHSRGSLVRRGERVEFASSRRDVARPFVLEAAYRPEDREEAPSEPQPASLEHFLTERYCLYARDARGLHRAEIHHPPWELRAADVELSLNTIAPDGIELSGDPLCHLAERQDVVIWPLECVQRAASTGSKRHQPGKKRANQED